MSVIGVSVNAQAIELRKVQDSGSDRLIVFIHGFHGDPIKTFKNASTEKTWWELMAQDEHALDAGPPLSQYDVVTVDYIDDFRSCSSLEDMAKDIGLLLADEKVFRDYNHIWIIAHSMGGLVIKRVLTDLNRPSTRRFLDRFSGIIFLAVPAQGSPLAKMVDKAEAVSPAINVLSVILEKLFGIAFECQVRDLLPSKINTTLQIIETQWKNLMEDRKYRRSPLPRAYCAVEKLPTKGFDVVPRLYASSFCDGTVPVINADHIDIAKPGSRSARLYRWARARIEESARLTKNHKTKTWPSVVGDGKVEPLGALIERLSRQHGFVDEPTGLPEVDEVILFADASQMMAIKKFQVVRGREFSGKTWADVFEDIDEAHPCLKVDISRNRREISLAISGRLKKITIGDDTFFTCHG